MAEWVARRGRPRGKSGYDGKGELTYGGGEGFGPERPKATAVALSN
ncbi:hypothetical protein N9W89_05420 [Hellea sp.]|nr:hypothetical protein [Hellea sp.]